MAAFRSFLGSRLGLAAVLAIAAAVDYLLWNHSHNAWTAAAPYLLVLACPLMHLFGQRHGRAAAKATQEDVMHRFTLAVAFTLATIGLALAQAPAGEDHSAHHPGQGSGSSPPTSAAPSPGTTGGQPPAMTQGMMQMMQGMQTMMRTMHQQAPSDQKQTGQPSMMAGCPMMSRGGGTAADTTNMQAMMRMMMDMMQMMQSQMQSGQMQRGPQ
jgi:hypothetical protein